MFWNRSDILKEHFIKEGKYWDKKLLKTIQCFWKWLELMACVLGRIEEDVALRIINGICFVTTMVI